MCFNKQVQFVGVFLSILTPEVVWEKCRMYIVGPLRVTTEGHKYILTFQDELSKYIIAVSILQQDAETIARVFVEEIVLKFGIPQVILTDQGSNFLSELFTNVCKLLKIKKLKNSAYHPQINGALERTHRVLVVSKMLHFGRPIGLAQMVTLCYFCI